MDSQIALAGLIVVLVSLTFVGSRRPHTALLWPWYAAVLLAYCAVFIFGTDAHVFFKVALATIVAIAVPALWWVDPVRRRRRQRRSS